MDIQYGAKKLFWIISVSFLSVVSSISCFSQNAPSVAISQAYSCSSSGATLFANASGCEYSVRMNGSNQYLDANTTPSKVWFSGGSFTVEGWVYVRSYNDWGRLIDFGSGEFNNNVLVALSEGTTGKVAFHIYQDNIFSGFTAPDPLPLNRWVHIACVFNSTTGTGTIFINGQSVASGTMHAPKNVKRSSCFIGKSNWAVDAYPNADMDELRIWSIARTEAEIQAAMNTTVSTTSTGLQAYWKMHEGTGTSTVDATGNVSASLINGASWHNASAPIDLSYAWSPATGLNTTTGATVIANPTTKTTYTVTVTGPPTCSSSTASASVTVLSGDPSVFGDNVWNVYAYTDDNFTNYAGHYTDPDLSFHTKNRWGVFDSPSAAADYKGCVVQNDHHSVSYKRTNFAAGTYQIDIPAHDDDAFLYIDGNLVFSHLGCCDAHTNVWIGHLGSTSTVEFRWRDYIFDSYGALNFTLLVNYTWNGSVSTEWNNIANWTPNSVPGTNDLVTIEDAVYDPVLPSNVTVKAFAINSGVVDLNGFTLGFSHDGSFMGGIIQNGSITASCSKLTFSSTTINATLSAACSDIFINASAFNQAVSIEKVGAANNSSEGGNSFNSTLTFTNSSTGNFIFGKTQADDFRGNLSLQRTASGTIDAVFAASSTFSGDIAINDASGIYFGSGGGTAILSGGNAQVISNTGAGTFEFSKLTINKTANKVFLNTAVAIANTLTFTSGNIATTATNLLNFKDNATATGASNASFVDGPVRKTGDDAFIFPTGKNSAHRAIGISAPTQVTDHFTAEFFDTDSNIEYAHASRAATINHLSKCEYWILNRTNGTSAVSVTLTWDNSCVVDVPADLLVARWDGFQWQNHGNGGTTVNSVLSGSAVTDFSPFTLGSTTENNTLPITLLSFSAKATFHEVVLNWSTLVELNNDYFTVERSTDARNFKKVLEVPGGGTSDTPLHYSATDHAPFYGTAYYRLKQTDYDGKSSYSPVVSVSLDNKKMIAVYPTSFDDSFKIEFISNLEGTANVRIVNAVGASGLHKEITLSGETNSIMIEMSTFPTGLYYIHVDVNGRALTTKVIKK